jgi:lipoprotein signal peptidase
MQAARGTSLSGPGTAPQDGPERGRPPRPRVRALLAIALAVLALDIATKITVVATLSDRPPIRLLGGFLTLRVDRNPGAAFSIGPSLTIVFSAIAVGVIIYILRTSAKIRSLAWAASLGLLLGGAAGNLADRLFRSPGPLRGYAVDWIEVPHWPVFNLADSAIVCGGVLAVLLAARGIRIDGSRVSDPADDAAAASEAAPGSSAPPGSETGADANRADAGPAGDPAAGAAAAGRAAGRDPGAAAASRAADGAGGEPATGQRRAELPGGQGQAERDGGGPAAGGGS